MWGTWAHFIVPSLPSHTPLLFPQQVNFQTELLWVAQVRGWSRVRLVPREPCDHYCPELLDDITEGQMGESRRDTLGSHEVILGQRDKSGRDTDRCRERER